MNEIARDVLAGRTTPVLRDGTTIGDLVDLDPPGSGDASPVGSGNPPAGDGENLRSSMDRNHPRGRNSQQR